MEYVKGYMDVDAIRNMNNVLGDFDFEKMHEIIVFLGWKWGNMTPDIYDIKCMALSHLMDAYKNFWESKNKNEETIVSSGGLQATYRYYFDDEDYNHFFTLNFIVVDSSN